MKLQDAEHIEYITLVFKFAEKTKPYSYLLKSPSYFEIQHEMQQADSTFSIYENLQLWNMLYEESDNDFYLLLK